MRKPTVQQLKLIKNIEDTLNIKFVGRSISEASFFIYNNLKRYKEEQEKAYEIAYNEKSLLPF